MPSLTSQLLKPDLAGMEGVHEGDHKEDGFLTTTTMDAIIVLTAAVKASAKNGIMCPALFLATFIHIVNSVTQCAGEKI